MIHDGFHRAEGEHAVVVDLESGRAADGGDVVPLVARVRSACSRVVVWHIQTARGRRPDRQGDGLHGRSLAFFLLRGLEWNHSFWPGGFLDLVGESKGKPYFNGHIILFFNFKIQNILQYNIR